MLVVVQKPRFDKSITPIKFRYRDNLTGDYVGFLDMELYASVPEALICSFDVRLPYRNQGIGSSLMELALEYARQSGCHLIYLTVYKNNRDAIRLYERFGFYVSEDMVTHQIMEKTL